MVNMKLEELGFSAYETKVYVALLKHGRLASGELSRRSGVPQGKVYETLYRLEKKYCVTIFNTRPKQFQAVPPDKAIPMYLDSRHRRMEEASQQIIHDLKALSRVRTEQNKTDELIEVQYGGEAYLSIVMQRHKTAQKYVKELFTFEYVPVAALREIRKAVRRGVKIRMIATKNGEEQQPLIAQMKEMGVEVRYYPVTELRLGIKDGIEAQQIIVNPEDFHDRMSMTIKSVELTKALEQYFDIVWEKAARV